VSMALTRDFKQTILARTQQDAAFRRELLKEGIETFLAGDVETGKTILRDYVNATIGFGELAEVTGLPAKSLMRMLGPAGNPTARNIFQVISHLQQRESVRFEIRARRAS
jgi:DNA-binding phage protein